MINKFYFIFFLMITNLFASPYHTNLLIQRGVDPQVLNLSVTTFRQNIAFKMKSNMLEIEGNKEKKKYFNILYDPFTSYGIDIRLQIPKNTLSKKEKKRLESMLDETMGLQSYLQSRELYDSSSFKLVNENSTTSIISFRFNKSSIPREIKFYNKLEGYVYISNNKLDKIVIKNIDKFKHSGVKVDNYQKVLKFSEVKPNNGYLINSINVKSIGKKNKEDYELYINIDSIDYFDENKNNLYHNSDMIYTKLNEDIEYDTIYVKLDRLFPLLGQSARKEGYDLPKAFGISLVTMLQNTTMHMTSFELDGLDIDLNKLIGGESRYVNTTIAPLLRLDMWLLPFLNIGVILGGTNTSTDITLHSPNGLTINRPFPPPNGTDYEIIKPDSKVKIDGLKTTSLLYGVGATIAGGVGNYFSTIDFQYITSYTSEADVSIDMFIMTPLIGYNFTDYASRIVVGAQYQDLQEELTFSIQDTNGESFSGKVGLKTSKWAGVLGVDHSFDRHWSGTLLFSKGQDISNLITSITYRW